MYAQVIAFGWYQCPGEVVTPKLGLGDLECAIQEIGYTGCT
jgi:hypothetical protein